MCSIELTLNNKKWCNIYDTSNAEYLLCNPFTALEYVLSMYSRGEGATEPFFGLFKNFFNLLVSFSSVCRLIG